MAISTVRMEPHPKGFALKLIHAHLRENRDFANDLVEEAKLAVRIRHRNVVSVFDVGEDDTGVFLVMEYVEGDTLASLLAESARLGKPLPWRVGLRVLLDALAGLQAAHDLCDRHGAPAGLVHRDFSPQNILVGLDGIGRLTDFGIAKATTRLSNTATGVIKGKVGYMSPEQVRGRPLDQRSDVWAAGVVAWEVVAGKRLFAGEEASVVLRIATETPPLVDTAAPGVPEPITRAIASALVTNPKQRCPSAAVFARALAEGAHARDLVADPGKVAEAVRELAGSRIEAGRERIRTRIGASTPPAELAVAPAAAADSPGEVSAGGTSKQDSPVVPPGRRTRLVVPVLGAVALFTAVGIGIRALRTPEPPQAAEAAVPPASSSAASHPAQPPSAAPTTSMPRYPRLVTVWADVPLQAVEVEGRSVRLDAPAAEVEVPVSQEEFDRGVLAEATAVDGRRMRVIGEGGRATVRVQFGAAERDTGTQEKRPPRFAPNPYTGGQR